MVGIGSLTYNSFIYATKIRKYSINGWLGVVFLSQIIKRTFDILQTFSAYVGINFGGFTTVVS